LPRQQREKLLDPDHGSYKLTLHELNDTIKEYHQEEITKCNLPDVLPVNVKYHNSYRHTHRSPIGLQPHFHSSDSHLAPQTAPVLNGNSLKSIFQFSSSSSPSTASTASVQSSASSSPLIPTSPFGNGHLQNSPKYTSQSTIDLKMTQVIDPKLYTNEELIKAYHQQKEACRELNKTILNNSLQSLPSANECDNNKIAVVRKLNMVESPTATSPIIASSEENLIDMTTTTKATSTESLEEKAMNEKSEKEIKKDEEAENSSIDELKLMQKSEIVLRVHPIMQETACQTDESAIEFPENDDHVETAVNGDCEKNNKCNVFTPMRKKHPEEVDCENLSKDLASQLSPSDKLHSILGELFVLKISVKFFCFSVF
jgi:protein Shroom